jgi:hypothetical protein
VHAIFTWTGLQIPELFVCIVLSIGGEFEVCLKMKCKGTGRKTVKIANSIVDFVSGILLRYYAYHTRDVLPT